MIYNNTNKKHLLQNNKLKQNVKKEYLKKNTQSNFNLKTKKFNKHVVNKITTKFLINNKRPTFLYYLYTVRKRELEARKIFNNSFLTQFKNSYKWTHFFLQKINSSNLRKFYIAKKPFFMSSSYGRYLNNKYLNHVPKLWIAKNLFWKVPLYKIHELLGIQRGFLNKVSLLNQVQPSKSLNNNLIECFNFEPKKQQTSFSYLYKIKQKKILRPYSFSLILNDITLNAGFFNYYSFINFYEKNKLVSKRSHKFPLNYLISKKYPSFMIVNYSIFSFCITKNSFTTPSFQLKIFLKNFIYYPIWYKSSFIY